MNRLVGHKFNLGSPRQLGELLFDRLELAGRQAHQDRAWATGAGLLDDLAANEELPEDARKLINTMLDWRQLSKLKLDLHRRAARLHRPARPGASTPPTRSAPTTTGRLASSDPTCRTSRSAPRRAARSARAFVAEPGNVADLAPTTARSSCACSPTSPTSRS